MLRIKIVCVGRNLLSPLSQPNVRPYLVAYPHSCRPLALHPRLSTTMHRLRFAQEGHLRRSRGPASATSLHPLSLIHHGTQPLSTQTSLLIPLHIQQRVLLAGPLSQRLPSSLSQVHPTTASSHRSLHLQALAPAIQADRAFLDAMVAHPVLFTEVEALQSVAACCHNAEDFGKLMAAMETARERGVVIGRFHATALLVLAARYGSLGDALDVVDYVSNVSGSTNSSHFRSQLVRMCGPSVQQVGTLYCYLANAAAGRETVGAAVGRRQGPAGGGEGLGILPAAAEAPMVSRAGAVRPFADLSAAAADAATQLDALQLCLTYANFPAAAAVLRELVEGQLQLAAVSTEGAAAGAAPVSLERLQPALFKILQSTVCEAAVRSLHLAAEGGSILSLPLPDIGSLLTADQADFEATLAALQQQQRASAGAAGVSSAGSNAAGGKKGGFFSRLFGSVTGAGGTLDAVRSFQDPWVTPAGLREEVAAGMAEMLLLLSRLEAASASSSSSSTPSTAVASGATSQSRLPSLLDKLLSSLSVSYPKGVSYFSAAVQTAAEGVAAAGGPVLSSGTGTAAAAPPATPPAAAAAASLKQVDGSRYNLAMQQWMESLLSPSSSSSFPSSAAAALPSVQRLLSVWQAAAAGGLPLNPETSISLLTALYSQLRDLGRQGRGVGSEASAAAADVAAAPAHSTVRSAITALAQEAEARGGWLMEAEQRLSLALLHQALSLFPSPSAPSSSPSSSLTEHFQEMLGGCMPAVLDAVALAAAADSGGSAGGSDLLFTSSAAVAVNSSLRSSEAVAKGRGAAGTRGIALTAAPLAASSYGDASPDIVAQALAAGGGRAAAGAAERQMGASAVQLLLPLDPALQAAAEEATAVIKQSTERALRAEAAAGVAAPPTTAATAAGSVSPMSGSLPMPSPTASASASASLLQFTAGHAAFPPFYRMEDSLRSGGLAASAAATAQAAAAAAAPSSSSLKASKPVPGSRAGAALQAWFDVVDSMDEAVHEAQRDVDFTFEVRARLAMRGGSLMGHAALQWPDMLVHSPRNVFALFNSRLLKRMADSIKSSSGSEAASRKSIVSPQAAAELQQWLSPSSDGSRALLIQASLDALRALPRRTAALAGAEGAGRGSSSTSGVASSAPSISLQGLQQLRSALDAEPSSSTAAFFLEYFMHCLSRQQVAGTGAAAGAAAGAGGATPVVAEGTSSLAAMLQVLTQKRSAADHSSAKLPGSPNRVQRRGFHSSARAAEPVSKRGSDASHSGPAATASVGRG